MAQQGRGELTCTPNGVINDLTCTKCGSETQLIAVLAVTLYALNHSGDYTLINMLNDGACFKCASDKQKLEGIVNSFVELAIANGYFDDYADVLHAAECLTCTDPGIVKGVIVKAVCEFVNSNWPLQV